MLRGFFPAGVRQVLGLAVAGSATVAAQVLINEINYEPPDPTDHTEFIELHNAGPWSVDLTGAFLAGGIFFALPQGTVLAPDAYLLIAEDPAALQRRFGVAAIGPYQGHLSNDGDSVVLRNAAGSALDQVDYGVGFPWPTAAAGKGGSIELIHPSLDNNLGGSWRVSRVPDSRTNLPPEPVFLIAARAGGWRYRLGSSEPSTPAETWRKPDFLEDNTWQSGQTSIGFGDNDDFADVSAMRGHYTSVYCRKVFQVADPAALPLLRLRIYVTDGCILWLNGEEVARPHVSPGPKAFDDLTGEASHPAEWEETLIEYPDRLLLAGANVLAAHAMSASRSSTNLSFDVELSVPAAAGVPTPGAPNSVFSEHAPPQIRQVKHFPAAPSSGLSIKVSAKVTDPDGVRSVRLHYQIVPPGHFVPAFLPLPHDVLLATPEKPLPPNPAFEDPSNWSQLSMFDDGTHGDEVSGDAIYTALIPPQPNRTLVRYRISAEDASPSHDSVRVPYPDDGSLNFAAFVYDGVPPYQPTTRTVHPDGLGHAYPVTVMTSFPVYHFLTRESDLLEAHAYNWNFQIPYTNRLALKKFNWEGALAYDGAVYDHIGYRLRQATMRYAYGGKRALRFRFHPGNRFQARDNQGQPYPKPWRSLNLGRMVDNKDVGNFGLVESMNYWLWNLVGVPAPSTHYVHLRVVDGPDEAPAGPEGQYRGDFWGMYLALEDYDPLFVAAHQMPDGNLYKLRDATYDGYLLKRHQGRSAVSTDADFQNILHFLRPERTTAWLRTYVNYDSWYRYYTVCEAVRHLDFLPALTHLKNAAWFFEPWDTSPFGRLWVLPWDTETSWGPSWYGTADYPKAAIFDQGGKPEFKTEYRNFIREFRDLLWREEVISAKLDELAALVTEFSRADQDRWNAAPYPCPGTDYGPIEAKLKEMKDFAFVGWEGSTGPPVPPGGQAAHLDSLANEEGEESLIPATPTLTYVGPLNFPVDRLAFEVSNFADPQGDDTFGAIRWRLAEVTDPRAPAFDPQAPPLLEWKPLWQSEDLGAFCQQQTIPGACLRPGHAYRVRAKLRDTTGHWSHWSAPVQFIAGAPQTPSKVAQALRITEIMYHPPGSEDYEYVEVANVGPEPLDLTTTSITGGITFSFAAAAVTQLAPGERLVVVNNLQCFRQRYPDPSIRVAGEYHGRLANGGDLLRLEDAWSGPFLAFQFDDAWYPSTDGLGFALVAADLETPVSAYASKKAWYASLVLNGSPGRGEPAIDRDGDGLPDRWELTHGLDPNNPADAKPDLDGDGQTVAQECVLGKDPRDPTDQLKLTVAVHTASVVVSFPTKLARESEYGNWRRFYRLQRKDDSAAPWVDCSPLIEATGRQAELTDLIQRPATCVFYRLHVWLAAE